MEPKITVFTLPINQVYIYYTEIKNNRIIINLYQNDIDTKILQVTTEKLSNDYYDLRIDYQDKEVMDDNAYGLIYNFNVKHFCIPYVYILSSASLLFTDAYPGIPVTTIIIPFIIDTDKKLIATEVNYNSKTKTINLLNANIWKVIEVPESLKDKYLLNNLFLPYKINTLYIHTVRYLKFLLNNIKYLKEYEDNIKTILDTVITECPCNQELTKPIKLKNAIKRYIELCLQ